MRLLQEAAPRRSSAPPPTPSCSSARRGIEQVVQADLARAGHGPDGAGRPVAFFCAEFGVHRSLPIYSGGLGALAGDILKEASDRALPLVAVGLMYRQGYFRQRIDGCGLAARVLGRHRPRAPARPRSSRGDDGEPLTITVPIHGERRRRPDLARRRRARAAVPARRRAPGERPARAAGSPRGSTSATRARGWPSTCCSASAACARCAAMGIDPASCTSTRATRRSPRSSSPPRGSGGATLDEALERPPAHGLHHPHAGPGRQRHLPAASSSSAARPDRRDLGVDPDALVRLGRTHPDDAARAVRRHAVRAAHEPRRQRRQPPPRRGRARDVAGCGPTAPVDDVPIGHVTNGVHLPTWVGAPMRALLDRHLGEDWLGARRRPGDLGAASTRSPTRSCGPCATRSAPRSSTTCATAAPLDRLARGEPRDYVEAAAQRVRPRRADDRLRAPPGDLQAAGPADQRPEPRAAAADRRPPDPDRDRRQGAPARRRGQAARPGACSRSSAAPRASARASSSCTTTTSRMAARLVARLRRLGQRPAPAAGGERHQRHEVGGQRRPATSACSTAGGPEAYDGTNGWALSGDVDARPRRPGRARRRRALPAARGGGRAHVLRRATTAACRAPGSRACAPR